MKRILCLILSCLLCVSGITVSARAEVSLSFDEGLAVLETLGVITEYDNLTLPMERKVSRAEFSSYIAKLLNVDDYNCTELLYYDVSNEHWAYDSITALTNMGYLTGKGEKLFYPDDYITIQEAYVVLAKITGYAIWADSEGGFPGGYIKFATENDLYCGSGEYLTMKEMITLMYKALSVNFMAISGISTYAIGDENILSTYYDGYFASGRVTGARGTSIYSDLSLEPDEITIDRQIFIDKTRNGYEMLGDKVKYLYIEEADDEYSLLWVSSKEKEALEITVTPECSFDRNTFTLNYIDGTKRKKAKISQNVSLIYNGGLVSSGIADILSSSRYTVKLISSYGDDYDIAVVEQYYNIIVGNTDTYSKIIYDKLNGSKSLDYDEDDREFVEVKDLLGEDVKPEEILPGSILSVFESKDKKYLKIVVSSQTSTGRLDKKYNELQEEYLTVDGVEYIVPEEISGINYRLGDEITLYLDVYGFVANIAVGKNNDFAAYLIKAKFRNDDDTCTLRLLTENGAIIDYDVSEKVRYDGNGFRSLDAFYNLICPGGTTKTQLIMCKVNSNNQISRIDPVGTRENSVLTKNIEEGNHLFRASTRNLGQYAVLGDDTIIFAVPTDSQIANGTVDNSQFMVKKVSDLKDDKTYTAATYKTSDKVGFEEYVVIKDSDFAQEDLVCVLVESITTSINSDDEIINCIRGYQGTTPVELMTSSKYLPLSEGVEKGDLIRIYKNADGEISKADIKFDYDAITRVPDTMFSQQFRIMTGYANDKVDNVLKVGYRTGEEFDEAVNFSVTGTILVYDSQENEIRKGSIADVRTYKNFGSNCSMIVTQTSYIWPHLIVIYN